MELDELKKMDIPEGSPIEIEVNTPNFPPRVYKKLGYFRGIDLAPSSPPRLTYYPSSDARRQIPERWGYEFLGHILNVSILVPK